MKAAYGVGLALVVAIGSTITAPNLYAGGDRKVVSDQDGLPWCSKNDCEDPSGVLCCGGDMQTT